MKPRDLRIWYIIFWGLTIASPVAIWAFAFSVIADFWVKVAWVEIAFAIGIILGLVPLWFNPDFLSGKETR